MINMLTFYTYKCEDYSRGESDEIHLWGINEQMEDVLIRVQGFHYSFIVEMPLNASKYQRVDIAKYVRDKLLAGMVHRVAWIEMYDYEVFGTVVALKVYLNTVTDLREAKGRLRSATKRKDNEWKCPLKVHHGDSSLHLQYISHRGLSYGNWHYCREYTEVDEESKISRATKEYVVDHDRLFMMNTEEGCTAAIPCSSQHCIHTVNSINVRPRVLSYDIECYSRKNTFPNANYLWDEVFIITASVADRDGSIRNAAFIRYGYTGATIPDTEVIVCTDELDLLNRFQQFIIDVNPEVCIGYNIDGFDNPYLTQRLYNAGLTWTNISKLKEYAVTTRRANRISSDDTRSKFMNRNKREANHEYLAVPGRLYIDLLKHVAGNYKMRSYSLENVSRKFLGEGKHDVKPKEMFRAFGDYEANVQLYDRVVAYGIQDSLLPIKLYDKLLVFMGLSKMAHVMYTNIDAFYTEGSAYRVKNMFYQRCVVRKVLLKATEPLNTPGYQGAKILDPDVGLHQFVYTLDLDSLYPNIIRSYNICFTTLIRDHLKEKTKDMPAHVLAFQDKGVEYTYRFRNDGMIGIIPELCGILIDTRTEVRSRKSSDPIVNMVNDRLQDALKKGANSIYGILGLGRSTIGFMEGARSVTAMGRKIIEKIVDRITTFYGHRVLYGDTDSVMAKIPGIEDNELVYREAERIRDELNAWLKAEVGKNLGLKLEKVGTIFLLKKKKYVYHYYIPWEKKMEAKDGKNVYHTTGAESVRRDKCMYQIDLFDTISDMIMKATPQQELYDFIYNAGLSMFQRYDVLRNSPLKYSDLFINYSINDYYKNESYSLAILMKRLKEEDYNISVGERTDVIITTTGDGRMGSKLFTATEFYEQLGITEDGVDQAATNERNLHPDIMYYIGNRMQKAMDNIYSIAHGKDLPDMTATVEEKIQDLLEEYSELVDKYSSERSKSNDWRDDTVHRSNVVKRLLAAVKTKTHGKNKQLRLLVFRLKLLKRCSLDFGITPPLKQLITLCKYRAAVLTDIVHFHDKMEQDVYDDDYYE